MPPGPFLLQLIACALPVLTGQVSCLQTGRSVRAFAKFCAFVRSDVRRSWQSMVMRCVSDVFVKLQTRLPSRELEPDSDGFILVRPLILIRGRFCFVVIPP